MTRLIRASLRYPIVTVVLTAIVVAAGVYALLKMPRTEDPSVTIRTGLVLAQYPGATSEQVERQVTRVIEEQLFTFPEVRKDRTFSTSRPGLSIVNVELQENVTGADVFWSKLRESLLVLGHTSLPRGVLGPIVNSDFGDTVALLIAIHGERYDYRQLDDYVERIEEELRRIGDVGRLLTYGGQREQIQLTGSLTHLSQYLADPGRIAQALQQRNVILPSGEIRTPQAAVPLRTTGVFDTEEQIRNVLVDISPTGQPVYVRDIGQVQRRYQDPSYVIRYDGAPAVLLSVEMQKGRNIVEMGAQVDRALARLREVLPPDLRVDIIANQPAVVQERLSALSHEFLLAIGSVILVTVLLLPVRVAAIAALAIPVTLFATLAVLNAIGVPLHQVSIAALIVVLGIVVDDAIVIADNYLELLDHGVPLDEAAWRSAADVAVPVLTATLTIIASFLPLLILSGATGEFISALPITVATALAVSFVVAILLTPILCRTFITRGLHGHEPGQAESPAVESTHDDDTAPAPVAPTRRSVLDVLQASYGRAITLFMRRRVAAVVLGLVAVLAGILLYPVVPQQFFPSAERNQLVIDVWTRTGTRIEATDAVMRRIEAALGETNGITHFAAFVGQSAPRFYYNVNPQQPDASYGQFVVNTATAEDTPRLVEQLRSSLARVAPEAMVIVKELQQGALLEAPIEIRISGNDIGVLQQVGRQVQDIVRDSGAAQFVHADYFDDVLTMDVHVEPELANRLGITNAVVSQLLSGGLDGLPIGTFWEGDRDITLVLRLDAEERASFEDVRNAYVISPVTQARVPLRAIASLEPTWQTGRIVRRNGVRTLTVRAFPRSGVYASDLLDRVDAPLTEMPLPDGYRLEYGGEVSNQADTMPQMLMALAISLLAIFVVLLVQFRTVRDPLVIMCSIPLALFGAMLGLVVTRNPFGFTAFMGLISLAGIVVRNAIILVEYIHERRQAGEPLVQAATEAGERRLRPIFLTTMAAAVGVTPMILSGSSLWSPLASVIAFGLLFSMFFTLLVIPVLFVIVEGRIGRRAVAAAALLCCVMSASPAEAQGRRLTLEDATDLALMQNTALAVARAQVQERVAGQAVARADAFPRLTTDSYVTRSVNPSEITIPAGAFGVVEPLGRLPATDTVLPQGLNGLFLVNATVGQPLTQLLKIRANREIAAADRSVAEANLAKAEHEVRFAVRQLYYGILAARRERASLMATVRARREMLRDSESAVASGHALEATVLGSRVAVLQEEHRAVEVENQAADLSDELAALMGLPPGTEFELVEPAGTPGLEPLAAYRAAALAENPEIRAAEEVVRKAESAVRAARYEFIPDVSAFARYTYQNGVPFVPNNNGSVGVQMTWEVFDWGKRRGVIGQREAQMEQARLNVERLRERLAVDLDKAYRKAERSRRLVDVAAEALAAQRENQRTTVNQVDAGFASEGKRAEVDAAVATAELKVAHARIGYELAVAELERVMGVVLHVTMEKER